MRLSFRPAVPGVTVLRPQRRITAVDAVGLLLLMSAGLVLALWPEALSGEPFLALGLVALAACFVYRWWPRRSVELHDDALVIRRFQQRWVPYGEITAVTGDVPGALRASTRLRIERRTGRPIRLPVLAVPVPEAHAFIVARAGLDARVPRTRPAA
ncbi:hypothetical protein [Georgenia faecalis]|uniref:PH domain-containing protein n=1 Tax=Georgenia faecalis TaxID=2483799 RepID=A0ABV9D709_9MICO|nr:hypothetical protein [Georgenia faecalis]